LAEHCSSFFYTDRHMVHCPGIQQEQLTFFHFDDPDERNPGSVLKGSGIPEFRPFGSDLWDRYPEHPAPCFLL
jgi:hypothetical protein